jgi:hypothetical protein
VNNAAREAGRQAAAGLLTKSQTEQIALSSLVIEGLTTTGASATATNLTSSSRPDPSSANQLDHFQIVVTLPYSNVQWSFFNHLLPSNASLTATVDWYSLRDLPVTVSTTIPVE